MYNWTSTDAALDALDPIAGMTPDDLNRLVYFSRVTNQPAIAGGLRQRVAGGLLKVAIMLDGRAQAAMIEAGGHR